MLVQASLKSISPIKSSVPIISVKITWSSSVEIIPIAIPLTGAEIGTHPAISASVEPQTEAIEVDHPEPKTSLTSLIVYGKVSAGGKTASIAFSANLP